ncbi:MAG TPA: deoxyuridine 5'-triphosphate nucleotidohydrolase [Candidatus Caccovicinus merdipullorum]|uniref:dUTP diphosphatase n=1 Tax=Candidatus Caccovicinus merdipullorum TaxID=2840724 RepID=A0A9D1GLF9_9FIRM|nr:deoxyuridine 5'-triphosphate nucleotidohydrolase [Candidatus Caccovicinus merdipullorum]
MKRVAKFEKVSWEQFLEDWRDTFGNEQEQARIQGIYDRIRLPRRATAGSAGYDFFLTLPIVLRPGESIKVPTGIRARMNVNWVLQIYPRSGLGFKYRLQMNNTVGIIDSDYFYSDNEGHIFIKILNDSREEKTLELAEGMAFAQGIFMEYGITEDDDVTESRNGGFGSTDGNK